MNPPYEFSVEEILNAVNNLKKFECDDLPNKKMCVLDFDLLNHIVGDLEAKNKRLEEENKALKDDEEQIRLFNLALENGEIDMTIESEYAKSFYNSIVQVFEQNGAKNFFTTTIDIEGKKGRYAFTIEKIGGKSTAEVLAEQKAYIEKLESQIKKLKVEVDVYEN